MKKTKIKKILFYTSIPRIFRTTLIGHLYELAQVYEVILLSEELDPKTERFIRDKELFPKLGKIIPVWQFTGKKKNLLVKNRELYRLAKNITEREKPDIIIAPDDLYPFEMYLMRFGKRKNVINIDLQDSNVCDSFREAKKVDLINIYLRFPSFLPLWLRFFLVKYRKHLGHFLYYWILPVMVGEKPFLGKSSRVLRRGKSGMRDADYQIVFSEKEYNIHLKDGVPAKKLYILSHPLKLKSRELFEKTFLKSVNYSPKDRKIACLLLPTDEIGFKKNSYSLIPKEEMRDRRIEIVDLIAKTLKDWEIIIKPHPLVQNLQEAKEAFESISQNIKVTEPSEPIDKYIEKSDIIVGLPCSLSTVLFTASLQCPGKPILSLDLYADEFLGDIYKDTEGVEYINNKEKFIEILELIKNDRWTGKKPETELRASNFSGITEVLGFLLKQNIQ